MTVPLSTVAAVIRGVTFAKGDALDAACSGMVPVLRAGNIADRLVIDDDLVWVPSKRVSREQRMQSGDIAICMSSGSPTVVGKSALLTDGFDGSVGAFCAILRPDTSRVVPAYLSYFLRSERFRNWTRQSSGSAIKNIRKSELEAFGLSLPDLEQQRRIVDLLARAEGIARLRREAQRKAAELIPAIFIDMFGDPATNPRAWPIEPLGNLLKNGPNNGLYKHKSSYGTGTPILRIDAFYDGVVTDLSQLKRVRLEDEGELRRFALAEGDIVVNRVNSPEYLGKSAIIPPLAEPTVFESNMMRFTVDAARVLPEMVIALLQQPPSRGHFFANAKHAINQSSINQQDVKSLPVIVPSMASQHVFLGCIQATSRIGLKQAIATESAQATFEALLARSFA